MDEYRRPIKANRYWSRPKPKIYECNLRDAERVYKDSYKEYQAEKDFRIRGARDWSLDTTDRFAHLRAGPLRRREASAQPYLSRNSESSSTASAVESILARASVGRDATSPEEITLPKSKPVPAYDPQQEMQSLEERLARLKRLREDLGLPQDTDSSKSTLRDSVSRTFATDNDTSSSYKSERSSRLASRAGAGADDSSSSYSYKSERSSKVNGIGGASSGDDYSFKSERKTEDYKVTPTLERKTERKREDFNITPKMERKSLASKTDDDYSFSSKTEKKTDRFSKLSATAASSSSSPGRTRKPIKPTEDLDFDVDDDASVVKMMKKLPSSQEILDRISKMDLDD